MLTFRRKSKIDPAELAAVRDEMAMLRNELHAAHGDRIELLRRINDLEDSLQHAEADHGTDIWAAPSLQGSHLLEHTLPAPAPRTSLDDVHSVASQALTSTFELRERVERIAAQVQTQTDENRRARDRVDSFEARLNGMTAELEHQLDELAGEFEQALNERQATVIATVSGAPSEEIDSLRTGQVRLAAEQARYEIAFRQELAELADQLRQRSS
jgi:predicted  nucleic acid-binding Zn-ribbon protein